MSPTAAIVANPRSGAGPAGEALTHVLTRALAERGVAARTIAFEPHRRRHRRRPSWQDRLAEALAEGAATVYVLGGDGTVLAVAGALLGSDTPLGVVPLGTANLLARDLQIPLAPTEAIAALLDGEVRRIDVACVNRHPFLCASMLGISTALAHAREQARGAKPLRLWARMLRKTLWMLRRYPYRHVRLELDGETAALRTRTMVVTNNPIVPEATLYPRRERLDAGLLGIYGVSEGSLWELPRLGLRLLNGTWPDDPRIFHWAAAQVDIRARRRWRVTVLVDGERLRLRLPLRYEILPKALSVLAPTRLGAPESSAGTAPP